MDKKATNAFSLPPQSRPRSAAPVRKPVQQQLHVFGSNGQRLTPEEIARLANQEQSIQLQQRLVIPRPTTEDDPADQSKWRQLQTIYPTSTEESPIASDLLVNKAPIRPKSAASTQGLRVNKTQRIVRHIPQDKHKEHQENKLVREEDHIMQSSMIALPTIEPAVKESATAVKSNEDRASEQTAQDFSMEVASPRGIKRPHTAGPGSRKVRVPTTIPVYDVHRNEPIAINELPGNQDPNQREFTRHIMGTFHKNTFIYAVPKHCLDPNEPFNPYNIVAIAHDALFRQVNSSRIGSLDNNSMHEESEVCPTRNAPAITIGGQEAKPRWNYYTISTAGFTYYTFDSVDSKDDNGFSLTVTIANEPEFVSTLKWETHKRQFETLVEKKTFHEFRCYKLFIAWKQHIRAVKMERVRNFLLLHLPFSHPILWNALKRIQGLLRHIESSSVFVLDFQAKSISIQEFERAQSLHLAQQRKQLQETTQEIQEELVQVFQQSLEEVETPLGAYPGEQFALSSRKSSHANIFKTLFPQELADNAVAYPKEHAVDNDTVDNGEAFSVDITMSASAFARSHRQQRPMSAGPTGRISQKALLKSRRMEYIRWTQAAVQRRKCQQLARFIHLVELIQRDFFFQLMSKSLRFLVSTLSMGANAAHMCSLMVRTDYLTAYRKALDDSGASGSGGHSEPGRLVRINSFTSSTTNAFGTVMSPSSPIREPIRGGIYCLTSRGNRMLSKQQTRRLLHYVIEGKFSSTSKTKESGVWTESKLEDFFMRRLEQHGKSQNDSYSLEEILYVAEKGLAHALQLPEFDAARCCIFEEQNGADERFASMPNIGTTPVISPTKETIDLFKIPALAPLPLFQLDLVLKTTKGANENLAGAQVTFEPSMETIQSTVREVIQGFALVFEDLADLSSHEDIRAVLKFAKNIRSSKIKSATINGVENLDAEGHDDDRDQDENDEDDDDDDDDDDSNNSPKRCHERLIEIAAADEEFCEMRDEVEQLLLQAFDGATSFTKCFQDMLLWYKKNEATDFELYRSRFHDNKYSLQQMEDQVETFHRQVQEVEHLCATQNIWFLQFHSKRLKNALLPSPKRCLSRLQNLLPDLLHGQCQKFLNYVRVACSKIQRPLMIEMDAFTTYLKHLNEVHDQLQEKDFELTFIHEFYALLDQKLQFQVPRNATESFELCDPEFSALKSQVNDAMIKKEFDIQEYVPVLLQAMTKLEAQVDVLQNETSEESSKLLHTLSAQQAREVAGQFEARAKTLEQQAHRLVMIQQVLGQNSALFLAKNPQKDFQQLYTSSKEIKVKNQLWNAICKAEEYLAAKSEESIKNIDLDQMNQVVDHVEKVTAHVQEVMSNALKTGGGSSETSTAETTNATSMEFTALQRLEESKRVLEQLAPIIRDLRNEHFQERHWLKLESKLQCRFTLEEEEHQTPQPVIASLSGSESEASFSSAQTHAIKIKTTRKHLMIPLRHLLNVGAVTHASEIHEISEEASAEAAIAKSYQDVASVWETKEIETFPKRDREGREIAVLSSESTTEIASLLEESEVLLRVIDCSSYGQNISSNVLRLLSNVQYTKETLELLVATQQQWENMQKMISSDFMRLFQGQGKILLAQDTAWKNLMDQIVKKPNVLEFGTSSDHRIALVGMLQGYEQVAKSLDEHFDLKRQMFPFFFRLSNEELAHLLSNCRDVPQNIQYFLWNCFENVGKIQFGQTKDQSQEVLGISSRRCLTGDGYTETISMGKNIKPRGPPEQWLASIEKRLGERLRKLTKEALALLQQAFPSQNSTSNNSDTVAVAPSATAAQGFLAKDFPIQCLLLTDRINRTQIIEAAFKEAAAIKVGNLSSSSSSLTRTGSNNSSQSQEELVKERYEAYSTSMRQLLVNYRGSESSATAGFGQNTPAHLTYRDNVLYTCIMLQEIRFRDAIMAHFATDSSANIDWSFQLKYLVCDASSGVDGAGGGEVLVEMSHVRSPYGFHYHSPLNESSFQVISPTSLRFLFGFFGCLRNAQSCLLSGPMSSGKSSLTLQMSRILGRICFGGILSMSSIGSIQHGIKMLRGSLHAGGVLGIKLIDGEKQQKNTRVEMFLRVFGNLITSIEHAFLTRMTQVSIDGKLMPLHYYQQASTTVCISPMLFFSMKQEVKDTTTWEFITKKWCVSQTSVMDVRYIYEAFLLGQQFQNAKVLALRLELLAKYLSSKLFSQMNLVGLWKQAIFAAGKRLKAFQSSSNGSVKARETAVLKTELQSIVESLPQQLRETASSVKMEHDWLYKSVERFLPVPSELPLTKEEKQGDVDQSSRNHMLFEDCITKAIRDLMLVPREELKNQVKQLASQITQFRGIVIPSETMTGKTTVYQVLAKTMDLIKEHLVEQEQQSHQSPSNTPRYPTVSSPSHASMFLQNQNGQQDPRSVNPFVYIQVVFPNALTTSQLYGSTQIDLKDGKTIQSVMGNLLRQAQMLLHTGAPQGPMPSVELPHGLTSIYAFPRLLWIVFDGQLDTRWLDNLVPMLDQIEGSSTCSHHLIPFHDGQFMQIAPNLRFLFEIQSLQHASPSFLQANAIVNMSQVSHHQQQSPAKQDRQMQQHQPLHQSYVYHWFQKHRHRHLIFPPSALPDTHKELMTFVYDQVLSPWLFEKNVLLRLEALITEHSSGKDPWSLYLTPLDRVRNFMSLLHSLLNTILLPTDLPTSGTNKDSTSGILYNSNSSALSGNVPSSPTKSLRRKTLYASNANTIDEDQLKERQKQQQMYHDIHVRVEIALLYSLLWGYAGCCSNHYGSASSGGNSGISVGLKFGVNFFLKKEFETNSTILSTSNGLAETWRQCGKDVNLFDVLMDLPNGRFVLLTSEILMQTSQALLSSKATANSNNVPGGSNSSESGNTASGAPINSTTTTGGALGVRNLFVPTFASLLTHALIKDSLRSGRGVLLVGGGESQEPGVNPVYRKTMLLRHFLPQLTTLQRILNPVAEDNSASQSLTTSIVGHIRLRQVFVAKNLAKRFRNSSKNQEPAGANKPLLRRRSSLNIGSMFVAASETQISQEDGTEELKAQQLQRKLFEYASESSRLQEAIRKFDNGDQIPFFFQFDAQNENKKQSEQSRGKHDPSELSRLLERMLQREHSGVYEPPPGKVAILLIDLHMPFEDKETQSSRALSDSISSYDLLRMLLSLGKAYSTSKMGKSVTVQDLLVMASLSRMPQHKGRRYHEGPLQRLFSHLFPVFVAPMGLHEINHVFLTLLLTHWERTSPLERLPSVVKQFLATVVAATTVLWEKGRRTQNLWSLHELSRLYEGLCSTEPSLLAEKDMVMRLWVHESTRSLVDRESSKESRMNILQDICSLKKIIESPTMNHIMSDNGTPANENNTGGAVMNAGSLSTAVLNHLISECLEKKATTPGRKSTQHSDQVQAANDPLKLSTPILMNDSTKDVCNEPLLELWSFLPSGVFFDAINNRSNTGNGSGPGNTSPDRSKRRNSISRTQSVTGAALGKFLYVPILSSDCSEDTIQHAIVSFYQTTLFTTSSFLNQRGSLTPGAAPVGPLGARGPLTTGVLRSRASNTSTSAMMATSDKQVLKLETALLLGQIARVLGRDGGRLVLASGDSCAEKEQIIRAVCKQQLQELLIFEPPCPPISCRKSSSSSISSASASCCAWSARVSSKWRDLLSDIYQSAGVENRNVTLFIPRADILLSETSSVWQKQLLHLLIQGDVPNAFTVEEQIKMTTKVKDERLVELESLFFTKRSRIIEDLEQRRDQELQAGMEDLRKENEQQLQKQQKQQDETGKACSGTEQTSKHHRSSVVLPSIASSSLEMKESSLKQEIEAKYKNILEWKEEQLKVRFQQENEDLMRKMEVENESLGMTLMSLMRPLGITSGKWNTILSNLHKKLHVVLFVEGEEDNNKKSPFEESNGLFEKIHLRNMDSMVIQQLFGISLQEQLQLLTRKNIYSFDTNNDNTKTAALWQEFASFVSTHLLAPQAIEAISSFASSIYERVPSLASSRSVWSVLKQVFSHSIEVFYKCWQQESIKRQRFVDLTKQLELCLLTLQARRENLDDKIVSLTKQVDDLSIQKENERVQLDQARQLSFVSQNEMDTERQVTLQIENQARIDLESPKKALLEANIVLMSLEKRHIIEIKSFMNPPPLVHLVFDALCILFGMMEPSWENAKKILNDPSIVTSLLQFDFDQVQNVQVDVLLNQYMSHPQFHPQEVNKQSIAAGYVVVWLRAVTLYLDAKRQMQPTIDRLIKAQYKLQKATENFDQAKNQMDTCEKHFNQLNQQLNDTKNSLDKMKQELIFLQTRNEMGQFVVKRLDQWKKIFQTQVDAFNKEMHLFLLGKNAILKGFLATMLSTTTCPSLSSLSSAKTTLEDILLDIVSPADLTVNHLPAVQLKLATAHQKQKQCSNNTIEEMMEDPVYYRLLTTGTCFSKVNLERAFWLAYAPSPVAFIKNFSYYMEFYMQKLAKRQWKWHTSYMMVSIRARDFSAVFENAMRQGHQLLVLDIDTLESTGFSSSNSNSSSAASPNLQQQQQERQQHPNANLLEEIAKWKTLLIDGVEHLILEKDASIAAIWQQQQQESDTNQESASDSVQKLQLPIHPSFRLFLTSYQDVSYFGCLFEDRFPTLDATISINHVQDIILDEFWYTKVRVPSVAPTDTTTTGPKPSHVLAASRKAKKCMMEKALRGRRFPLYIRVKELNELHDEVADMKESLCDQMDQAIQIGTFMGDELEQMKKNCHQLKQIELLLQAKREEVHTNIVQLKQDATRFAKIGAAVYRALQTSQQKVQQHLPFHLYLQFVTDALRCTKDLTEYSCFLESLLVRVVPLVPRANWHMVLAHVIKELEKRQLNFLSKTNQAKNKYQVSGEIYDLSEVFMQVSLDTLVSETLSSSSGGIHRLKQLVLEEPKNKLLNHAAKAIQEQQNKQAEEDSEKEQTQDHVALFPTELVENTTLVTPGSAWWWFRVFCTLFPTSYVKWIERFLGVTDRITGPTSGNLSWHAVASSFPEDLGVVFVTPSIGSFELLQQIFLNGLETKEDRWNSLQLLLHRHFQTSEDFKEIFTLPRIQQPAHMLALETNNTAATSASSSSTSGASCNSSGSSHSSTRNILVTSDDTTSIELLTQAVDHILMLKRPEEILKEKPEVLMHLRLILLEFFTPILQSSQEELDGITRWEELFQLLQRTVSRTSSLCFRRNPGSMALSTGWTTSKWSATSRKIAGVGTTPITNAGTGATPPQSSQLITKKKKIGSSSLIQRKYPRVVSLVEDINNIPVHLRGHTLSVEWKSTSEGHIAGYFKSVALRLACVPFFKHLEPLLTNSGSMVLDATALNSASTNPNISGPTLAWRLLSALVLFHSLLSFRHDTLVNISECEHPSIEYSWSEFITALYLLLDTVETLLLPPEEQKKKRASNVVTLLKTVQQQVVLGVYSRKTESSGGNATVPGTDFLLRSSELRFITSLWKECLMVMRIPTKESLSSTTEGSTAITSNASESLTNILGVFSVQALGHLMRPDGLLEMFMNAAYQLESPDSTRTVELKLRQFLRLEEHVQLGMIMKRPPVWLERITYEDVKQTKFAANSILNTLLQALSFCEQEDLKENASSKQTSAIDMYWNEVAQANADCICQLKNYLENLKINDVDKEEDKEQETKQAIVLNHVPSTFQRYVPWTLKSLQDFMLSLHSSYQFFSHAFTRKNIWYAPAVSSIAGLIEMTRLHCYETFPMETVTGSGSTERSLEDIEIEFYLVGAFDPVVMEEQEPDEKDGSFTLILSGLKLVGARWNEKLKVLDNIDTSSSSTASTSRLREKWDKNVWLIVKFQDKEPQAMSNTPGTPVGTQEPDKRRTSRDKVLCPLVRRRVGAFEYAMKSNAEILYEFELPASSSFSPFTVPILQYTYI